MIVKIISMALALLGAAAVIPGAAPSAFAAKGVLLDEAGILREFFPGADRIEVQDVILTPELALRLKSRLGYVPVAPKYEVHVGWKDGRELGYAIIDEEKGMHEPITFAVLLAPDGSVKRQEVMVYRETEGDGVTARRFTRQFIGKTMKDPIRAGIDITIVSSATISSNSMAVGVRRAVALVGEGILAVPAAERASLGPNSAALRVAPARSGS